MKAVATIAIGVVLCSLAGCGERQDREDDPLSQWYPFKVGNWWRYEEVSTGDALAVGDTLTFTIIDKQTVFGGHTGYQCLVEEGPVDVALNWYVLSDEAIGIYYGSDPPDADTLDHYVLLRLPVEVGNRWQAIISGTDTTWAEIVSTTDEVRVPAGHFLGCVSVELGYENPQYIWFAPGVGYVRYDYSDMQDRLIEYHLD